MRLEFFAPTRQTDADREGVAVAEARLVFDDDSPLGGMVLQGFVVRQDPGGRLFVLFPGFEIGEAAARTRIEQIRTIDSSAKKDADVRDWIIDEYLRTQSTWRHTR